jgi:hypothetical protein
MAEIKELARGLGGVDHLAGGALADALRLAVAPDIRRQDGLVAGVDVVADGLADQVAGDGKAAQAVSIENVPALLAMLLILQGLIDVKMVAPAGQFQAVIPEHAGLGAELFKGHIRPLAGEEGDVASHVFLLIPGFAGLASFPTHRDLHQIKPP